MYAVGDGRRPAAHPFSALQEGSVQSKAGRGEPREDGPELGQGSFQFLPEHL